MIEMNWRESQSLKLSRRLTWLMRAFAAAPGAPPVARIERDVRYVRHAGVDLVLDVVVPRGEGPWPVVLMIHGGGFVMGDKVQLERTCRTLAGAGFLVFNANYRLAPEHRRSAQVEDCVAALRWVKEHAGRYGGDPARLCVGGGSAGAYHVATLGVLAQRASRAPSPEAAGAPAGSADCGFQAALLLNGVFDLEASLSSGFPRIEMLERAFLDEAQPDRRGLRAASPIHALDDGFPPAFIGVGTRDPLYGESLAMCEALSSRGVPVEMREYRDSTHGWFNWFWTQNARDAHDHMIAWLRRQLG